MSEIRRSSNGDVTVFSPPAETFGAAPLPGSRVPTPARLAAPTVKMELTLTFAQMPDVIRALYAVMGDEFDFVPNPQVLAMLPPNDLMRLQKVLREREDRRG
jgi:hypothetical protein